MTVRIGVAKIFEWGGGSNSQITCNDFIKIFRKRNFLWDKDIMEWKIMKLGPSWHLTRTLPKEEGLQQKLKSESV